MSNKNSGKVAKRVAITAVTAAIYVVLTVPLPIPTYEMAQYRVAEVLNLLVFYNPVFMPGVVLGVFISNMFSPYMVLDMPLGTLATVLSLLCIRKAPNLFVAALFPIIFNAPIVGLIILLLITYPPYLLSNFIVFSGWVALGQTAVMLLTAYPLFKILEKKNPQFIKYIKGI